MSTEPRKKTKNWIKPVLLSLPFLAVIAAAVILVWPTILKLINVAVKAAVYT